MAGSTIKTRAEVIRAAPYGESDLIVTFLTEDHGLVKGFAKGALRSRKRFVGCFEPFTMLELGFTPSARGGLARVDSADVMDAYRGVRDDLGRIEAGAVVLELAAAVEPPPTDAKPAFSLVHRTLSQLASSPDPHALAAAFCVKYMTLSGYMAPLSACSACGEGLAGKKALYAGSGVFCCPRCAGGRAGSVLCPGAAAFVSCAQSLAPSKLGRLRASGEVVREIYGFIKTYASETAGVRLKSLVLKIPSTFS